MSPDCPTLTLNGEDVAETAGGAAAEANAMAPRPRTAVVNCMIMISIFVDYFPKKSTKEIGKTERKQKKGAEGSCFDCRISDEDDEDFEKTGQSNTYIRTTNQEVVGSRQPSNAFYKHYQTKARSGLFLSFAQPG